MKNILKSTAVSIVFMLLSQVAFSQKNDVPNFKDIDLKKMRKTIIEELLKDDLIKNKKEEIQLALRTSETLLNGKVLDDELHVRYGNIVAQFEVGRGSYRIIIINRQCTAVGDFHEDSFNGKAQGKLSLKDVAPSAI
ncbi:MAG: hypothetical protein ABJG47_09955 [Ekhidna sp.]